MAWISSSVTGPRLLRGLCEAKRSPDNRLTQCDGAALGGCLCERIDGEASRLGPAESGMWSHALRSGRASDSYAARWAAVDRLGNDPSEAASALVAYASPCWT